MIRYSFILPVHNESNEIENLSNILNKQTFDDFVMVIIEVGRTDIRKVAIDSNALNLDIRYLFQENSKHEYIIIPAMKRVLNQNLFIFNSDRNNPLKYLKKVGRTLSLRLKDIFDPTISVDFPFSINSTTSNIKITSVVPSNYLRAKESNLGNFHLTFSNISINRLVFNGLAESNQNNPALTLLEILSTNRATSLLHKLLIQCI